MVLIRGLALLLLATVVPAAAHKGHQNKNAEQGATAPRTVLHPMSPAVHEAVKEDLERIEAEAAKPPMKRTIDWMGRIHPFAVHFPLALFPIAWVALALARRRDREPDATVRALVVVAGGAGVLAALLGWINGGWTLSDADPVLAAHRWLGTTLGLGGGALAYWAWRGAASMKRAVMAWVLGLVTLALLVQGWLGAALIHGIDHLAW